MDPALEHADLDPPSPPPVLRRGLPIAIVAHVLLAVALAWGLQWKRQPDPAMAAIPLPPVTAAAPSTATMGGPPAAAAPSQQGAAPPPSTRASGSSAAPSRSRAATKP